jgi:cytochrome b
MAMPIFAKIRLYHCGLIILTALAYLSGELGEVHEVLGYGVAAIIILRILWGVVGPRQVGISRFFPHLDELRKSRLSDPAISRLLISIVAITLIATTVTGILLEEPAAHEQTAQAVSPLHSTATELPKLAVSAVVPQAKADDGDRDKSSEEDWLTEVHELVANLLVLAVAAHVLYLFLFKRDLALYMLFVRQPKHDGK